MAVPPVHDCPSTGGPACSLPQPGLHSSRAQGGPSATGSTKRTVGRPQWGKTCRRLQPSARDQTRNRSALEPSPCTVVRMKPVPQRRQENVCGARPQFQTTRTFLRPHPRKELFPQKHLPCSKRPLLTTPHAPRVLEGESADVAKESMLGTRGPGPGAPKKKTFQELSLLPRGFYRCPLLTSPQKMTLNLPSNKNKYMCLFPEPLTALSWPRDLGRIDGPASLGSRVHLLLKVVSQ